MSKQNVNFFIEDLPAFSFKREGEAVLWLNAVVEQEHKVLNAMSIVFCSDEFLLDINKEYLNHDYYTDIITFPLHEAGQAIEADVFISVDRVAENAKQLKQDFDLELNRVMVHGLLHLIGYGDATDKEKVVMREREDFYLTLMV